MASFSNLSTFSIPVEWLIPAGIPGNVRFNIVQSGAEVRATVLTSSDVPFLVGKTLVISGAALNFPSGPGTISGNVNAVALFDGATPLATLIGLTLGVVLTPFGPLPLPVPLADFFGAIPVETLLQFADTLNGNDVAADVLRGYDGDDTLLGGLGNDTLIGDGGVDSLIGGAGNDVLFGGAGDDVLSGGAGDDTLDGGLGSTDGRVRGDEGDDVFIVGDGAFARLEGGAGTDTFLYEGSLQINMSLTSGTLNFVRPDNSAFGSQVSGIERFRGGLLNDLMLAGTANGAVVFAGNDGDDTLVGGAFNDTLFGEEGRDSMDGGVGDDLMYAGPGGGIMQGGVGNDTLSSAGLLELYTLDGGTGDDLIFLSGGGISLSLTGNDGNDVIYLNDSSNAVALGGAGDDAIAGFGSSDTLSGETGADTLFGGDGDDLLLGGDDADLLYGDAGQDTAQGGAGNDVLGLGAGQDLGFGGEGADILFGGDGNDTLNGEAGTDILYGGMGNDPLDGGDGFDQLNGGEGDDTLGGGAGSDQLWGGLGADRFFFAAETGVDQIVDFSRAEGDRIDLSAFTVPLALAAAQTGAGQVVVTSGGPQVSWVNVFIDADAMAELTFAVVTPGFNGALGSGDFIFPA